MQIMRTPSKILAETLWIFEGTSRLFTGTLRILARTSGIFAGTFRIFVGSLRILAGTCKDLFRDLKDPCRNFIQRSLQEPCGSLQELVKILLGTLKIFKVLLRSNPWLPSFFSLDWQFSTWSTWCANYSFIRLRKVVFFGAQKPLIFVRH